MWKTLEFSTDLGEDRVPMSVLISAVAFFILLTFLILLHEAGHFFAARKAGVTVEEFGFGLPPRAKTLFWKAGTRFSLNWIPFGGFVRLRGENAVTEKERRAHGSFGAAPVPARIVILTAGVAMNFLVAIVIFLFGFSVWQWIPTYVTFEDLTAAAQRGEIHMVPAVLIDAVVPGEPAEKAAIPIPSILAKVDGTAIESPQMVVELQEGKTEVTYTLLVGENFTQEQTIKISLVDGKSGVTLRPFPRELSAPRRSPVAALYLSLREAWVMTVQTMRGIGSLAVSLATKGSVPEGITGIVGIAQLTHASVQEGFLMYLRLVALLNLSLAVLNILPVPALDGGRLLFVVMEVVRGRPMNRKLEIMTNAAGFLVLLFLILLITYHDVLRLL